MGTFNGARSATVSGWTTSGTYTQADTTAYLMAGGRGADGRSHSLSVDEQGRVSCAPPSMAYDDAAQEMSRQAWRTGFAAGRETRDGCPAACFAAKQQDWRDGLPSTSAGAAVFGAGAASGALIAGLLFAVVLRWVIPRP